MLSGTGLFVGIFALLHGCLHSRTSSPFVWAPLATKFKVGEERSTVPLAVLLEGTIDFNTVETEAAPKMVAKWLYVPFESINGESN